ncbi:MAG: heavy metal sensor histidine kinase [Verrucomicrobia bacterium]|nr:heavy metal sensor histidine kinase [Verrucomicrobiota bacterium]
MNREPHRSWSMVFRLSASYAAITIALLSLFGAFLFWSLKDGLETNARNTLADKISVMRQILRERPNDQEALEEEVQWESTARRQSVYYSRLLRDNGTLVIQSPGAQDLIPELSLCPPPAAENRSLGDTREVHPAPERTLLISSALIASAGAEKSAVSAPQRFVYTVALDTTTEQNFLHGYRDKLLLVLIGGSVVSAVAGTYVARQGIRPIKEISAAAHRITASDLAERVGSMAWPRELAGLAAEFDAMLQRLEDSFQRLSQFSADIAHELRTPINNLMGEAEVALRRERTSKEYAVVIASSLEEYHRLAGLIDSLLFLARAENADLSLQKSWFRVADELAQLLSFHELQATESEVTLSFSGDTRLFADSMLFRRAISNVLSNALKHTPAGGNVTLEVLALHDAVRILIKDDGIGIPPEHLPRLFDRFYRVDAPRADAIAGSGLGLAIGKSIVYLHGGSVTIESEPGKGTSVTLVFPLPPGVKEEEILERASPPSPRHASA